MLTSIEGFGGALQHLKGQGRHDVSLTCNSTGSLHSFTAQGGDHLCPVDERQTLWKEREKFLAIFIVTCVQVDFISFASIREKLTSQLNDTYLCFLKCRAVMLI